MNHNYTKWTRDEEYKIFKEYNLTKDKKIKDKIFNKNIFFVKRVVNIFKPHPQDYDDYFSEGCMGMLTAIDNFDYTQGNKFSTFSVWWINANIMKYICQKSKNIRIPMNVIELVKNQNKKVFKKTINDVYTELNLNTVYLDKEISGKYDKKHSVADIVSDERYYRQDESYIKKYLSEFLKKDLSKLDEFGQRVMKMYYGIDCHSSSFHGISEQLGSSMFNVRKAHDRCISKIKRMHKKDTINKINDYLNTINIDKVEYV